MVETVEEAVAEARSRMFNQSGVVGMGSEKGRVVIDVRDTETRDELLERHGSTFAGFPLEIQVTGGDPTLFEGDAPRPTAELQAQAGRDDKFRPVVGGVQTGVEREDVLQDWWGTLTGYFLDRDTGEPVYLSNKHVWGDLDGEWPRDATEGTQPSAPDSEVGSVDRWAETEVVEGDSDTTSVDTVGVSASVEEAEPLAVLDVDNDEYVSVTGYTEPTSGMEIMKSGARTGTTWGEVVETHTSVYLDGPDLIIEDTFKAQIASSSGDSGAIALDEDGRFVGQLFAGVPNRDVAWFNRVPQILDAVNVVPATEEGGDAPFRESAETQGSPASVVVAAGVLPFALAATPEAIDRLRR